MGDSSRSTAPSAAPHAPSRWWTAEFAVYVVAILALVPWHTLLLARALERDCTSAECQHRLAPGWLFGRRVDLTDVQWRDFRDNLPVLTALALAYLLLSHAARRAGVRVAFYMLSGLGLVAYLYGAHAVFVLALVLGNYALARAAGGSRAAPALIWAFNLGVLLSTEWLTDYYRFAWLLGPAFAALDTYRGPFRWYVGFNLVVLRMISFSMDHYWACRARSGALAKRDDTPVDEASKTYDQRTASSLESGAYSAAMYLAYVFYLPLHIAGPTITFNAFASQVLHAPREMPWRGMPWYALKLALSLFAMEAMLHTFYCYAVTQSRSYGDLPPAQLGLLGYYSLHLIWLKFYIIWRFFRLWALLDGVETVENMNRCMSNNYNLQGFWRSWHRSFNRWLVRYLYVPLGGNTRKVLITFLVFTFTAVWHDLSLRLLVWGWLLAVFVVPEELLAWYFRRPALKGVREAWYYRHLCALGGAINIFAMMVCNLIGFSLGVDGMVAALERLLRLESVPMLAVTIFLLFAATQFMFEWRAGEARVNRAKDF